MSDRPWYHAGLKFRCTACGNCCTGDAGYVWVRQAEIEALAEAVGLEVADFEEQFVRWVGRRKSLIELPGGDCVFFNPRSRRCKVYLTRPRQCRTWPFWESNVRTPEDWAYTCRICPGSGRGRLISSEDIEAHVRLVRV